jgi:hypothetical protein
MLDRVHLKAQGASKENPSQANHKDEVVIIATALLEEPQGQK